jgi:FixJ family two-component response regulator
MDPALARLSDTRGYQVLGPVVTGMLNKQVAGELGAAEKTIKVHRGRIMAKMCANSVVDLVRMTEKIGVKRGDRR